MTVTYRYKGKPIPSLQSIDHEEKVIYLGTFSKSIAPSLRISYMVLPLHLLKKYQESCSFYSTTVSKIQQEVLREFIRGGYFGRHLNKMRGIYKNKHDFLVGELKKKNWVENIAGDNAGLHVLVQVNTTLTEEEICKKSRRVRNPPYGYQRALYSHTAGGKTGTLVRIWKTGRTGNTKRAGSA